jgi:hypothetical protein
VIRVVTAYTPDYSDLARRLLDSCAMLGVPTYPVAFESLGDWKRNCAFKPTALLDAMTHTGDDVLWLDADMVLLAVPPLDNVPGDALLWFSDPPEATVFDFALKRNVPNVHRQLTPWGGHCAFRNTYLGQAALKAWRQNCDWYGTITNDEQCLMFVLDMMYNEACPLVTGHGDFTIGPLPDPAMWVLHRPVGAQHGKPTAAEGWI